jgi:DNA-binding beta-propeller fold protein YncE
VSVRRRTIATLAVGAAALLCAGSVGAGETGGRPVALVTAEAQNELLAVSLPDGRVVRRLHVDDPQTIAAAPSGLAVVVSPAGTVTLVASRTLRPLAVLRGFRSPQVAAIAPDGRWAYVTDAGTGDLAVIRLARRRVVDRVFVGLGAHHLAVAPDGTTVWVALGEHARMIVVVDTSRAARPRVVRRISTRFPAHDLAFAPDGATVWVGSANDTWVRVLSARTARVVARVAAGPPPQHVAFLPYGAGRAYVTSGYGSQLELVDPRTRRVVRRMRVPYGSFNLATGGDLVVTTSLLTGRLTELNGADLAPLLRTKVATRARDVAIGVW